MERIEKIIAFVVNDEMGYVVYASGKGGAIIGDADKEKAKAKFEEATKMAYAMWHLDDYADNAGRNDYAVDKAAGQPPIKMPKLEFEFIEGEI